MQKMSLIAGCWVIFAVSALGQGNRDTASQAGAAENRISEVPTYAIVSIKLNKTARPGGMAFRADGFEWENTPLYMLVQGAYGIIMDSQVQGLPSWA